MNEWLRRFERVHPPVALRNHDPKFGPVFVRGVGSRLWDTDGNDHIDLTCGYSAANFGQAFPPLIAAATRQLNQLTHVTGEPHVPRIELAEQLQELFPCVGHRSQVLFNVSGARSVETAWKAAVAFRPGKLMSVGPCFHGRSIATTELSQAPSTGHVRRQLADAVRVMPNENYPYCAACPWSLSYPSCDVKCAANILETIARESKSLSAVIVEPAIGARGYIVPPAEFMQRLRELTTAQGVLMIADEIQSGLGRCGHLSLAQGQGWQPDLLVLGKSLGGGVAPISAVLGRADVLESLPVGSESETFAASPLAAAVGLQVLSLLRDGEWIARGRQLGEQLRHFAREELQRLGWVGCEVEGIGASCIVEFRNLATGLGASRCRQFAEACACQRVLTHFSGPELTRCVWLPPLTMSQVELDDARSRLHLAFLMVATT